MEVVVPCERYSLDCRGAGPYVLRWKVTVSTDLQGERLRNA